MTKREAEIRCRADYLDLNGPKEDTRDVRDCLAEIDRLRQALVSIAGWCDRVDPKIIEDRARQALKETE